MSDRPNPQAFIWSAYEDSSGRVRVESLTPWILPDPNPFPTMRLFTLRRKAKR